MSELEYDENGYYIDLHKKGKGKLSKAFGKLKRKAEQSYGEYRERKREEDRIFKDSYRKAKLKNIRVKAKRKAKIDVLGEDSPRKRRKIRYVPTKRSVRNDVSIAKRVVGTTTTKRKKRKSQSMNFSDYL